MSCLSWNCRGLGNPSTVRALRELIRTQKADIVLLHETLVHYVRVEEVKRLIDFRAVSLWKKSVIVGVLQFSGGIISCVLL